MKSFAPALALMVAALAVSTTKAGVLSSYNLIASPGLAYHLPAQTQVTPGIIAAPQGQADFTHPVVVENAIAESQLPPELLNPFYKNPAIAAGLAKESWFGDKEFPVHHREAEKIPRSEIFKIISRLQGH